MEHPRRSEGIDDRPSCALLSSALTTDAGLAQEHVARHFFARVLGLIVVPAAVYLLWFWVHFAVLTKSGTGDEFMSPAFQQTLLDSPLTALAEG